MENILVHNLKYKIDKLSNWGVFNSVAIKTTILGLFIKTVYLLVALYTQMVLTRSLMIDEYGEYSYILTFVQLLMLPAALGIDKSSIRYVSQYIAKKEWGLFKGFIKMSSIVVSQSSFIVSIVFIILIRVLTEKYEISLSYAISAGSLIFVVTAIEVKQQVLRSLNKVVLHIVPSIMINVLLISLVLMYREIYNVNPDKNEIIVIHLFSACASYFLLLILCKLNFPKDAKKAKIEYRTNEWLKTSLPMLVTSVSILLSQRIDIVMLGVYKKSSDVGMYIAATKIANLSEYILSASNIMFAPMIARLYYSGKIEELGKQIRLTMWYVVPGTIIIGLVLSLFAGFVLKLFGDEFLPAKSCLYLLIIGHCINGISGPMGFLLTMTGHQNDAMIILLLSMIINVILNYLMIPIWGIEGAALATGITLTIYKFFLMYRIKKRIGLDISMIKRNKRV